ncbi:MAG: metal ABC transporter substrate-binding protein [Acidimicrobiales bacterium]|nr:metal ABC transporter substrate-binding protein [Acidimicrobiales bacterium]
MFQNSNKKLFLTLTALIAVISLALTGCSDDNSADMSSPEEKPLIVVTTNILGDVVTSMVGDNFDVEIIMPPGSDPHDFQASAKHVAKIMEADLLIANGANFEEGMLDVLAAAESDGVMIFEAISFVNELEAHDDHGEEAHDDHESHDHGGVDPHFFTDPARMAQVVEGLSQFLVANFPEVNESSLVSNATSYMEELESLDAEVEEILSVIPVGSRILVTNHSVFEYFADRYQFEILGSIIPSSSTLSSASAKQIANLAEELKLNQITAIFADASSSDALAQALAGEADNVKVINLYSESLGDPNSIGATYIDMVRFNAEAVASALFK